MSPAPPIDDGYQLGAVPGEFQQAVTVSTTLGEHPYIIFPQSTDRFAAVEVVPCGDGLAILDFVVDVRVASGGAWIEGYLTADDFVPGTSDRLLWCSAITPHTVVEGQQAGFIMRVGGARAIRFRLRADDGGVVKVRGRMRP